jgi:hypothetical protein
VIKILNIIYYGKYDKVPDDDIGRRVWIRHKGETLSIESGKKVIAEYQIKHDRLDQPMWQFKLGKRGQFKFGITGDDFLIWAIDFFYYELMNGFFNQLLRVDLTKQETSVEPIPESVLRSCLGGKGLGSYLLLKENPPQIDPFSSENRLVFTLGPLADTPFYGSSRYAVFTKSPQTGIYSESYSGGKITLSLSRTGYDAIIIEGRSSYLPSMMMAS